MSWLVIGSVTEEYKEAMKDKNKLKAVQTKIHENMVKLYGVDAVNWLYNVAKGKDVKG